jgi:cGMP-dependent protein kinase
MLEHMHSKSVVYRDLKPESLLVDEDGYLKIIDFGAAKVTERTYTIIGTPHYMAPETIVGCGYNNAVDYWSLGIMIYEFFCGYVPFGEDLEEPLQIYKTILIGDFDFPPIFNHPSHDSGKEIILQFLSNNPTLRNLGGLARIKNNSMFAGFEWDSLFLKQVPAPYKPKLQKVFLDKPRLLKKYIKTVERKTTNLRRAHTEFG